MEFTDKFIWVLVSSSLWLSSSGLVLWLCLRNRRRLAPGTRAAASILVAVQGWIWFGIPVEVNTPWIRPQSVSKLSQIALPNYAIAAGPIVEVQARAALPADSRPYSDATSLPDSKLLPHSRSLAGSGLFSASSRFAGPVPLSAAKVMSDFVRMFVTAAWAIWIAGIAILLLRSIYGFLALSRMVHALPHAPSEWKTELAALCRQHSIGTPPLLKFGNVATPMLVQPWGRTCIVVPAWLWQSCTDHQRASILLHELAHHRRGDLWRQLAMRLLILPHWFNPVAWWAARQFEAANEEACDDMACGGDPIAAISYSKALLVLNERLGIRYAPALAVSGGSLAERVRRILHPEFQKESQMSKFLILSAMTILAGLAAIRIQAADESSAAKTEAADSDAAQEPGVTLRRRTITEEYEKTEPVKTETGSLLANGGFEELQGSNDPEAWFATRVPKTAGHFLLASSSVAHGGKRSVVVEIGVSHPDMPVHYNWTAEAHGWKAGETYELSGWIKTENAKGPGFLMAQCWSADGKRALGYSESPCEVKGTTDWTRVSTLLSVPEGTASVRIRAGLTSQNNKGAKAWLDDLSLVKVSRSANDLNKNRSAKNEPATGRTGLLIANGGFEEVQANSGDPEAWFGTRVSRTAGHFVLASSSVAHGGKRSAVVEIGDSHPEARIAYNWTAPAQGWKAGETYELSGWVKTENVKHPAFIMAQFWGEEGLIGGATTQKAFPVKGTTDWTRVTTRLKVPEGTGELRIRAGLSSLDNRGAKAWLDDISLVKVASN